MYIQASEEFHVTDMRLICSQKKKRKEEIPGYFHSNSYNVQFSPERRLILLTTSQTCIIQRVLYVYIPTQKMRNHVYGSARV